MVIFTEKREFCELTTKKRSSEFCPGKSEIFSGKFESFSTRIENFCYRIHVTTPQISNQIDPADLNYCTVAYPLCSVKPSVIELLGMLGG